jgi:UDP-N-acetylglucosamine 2-epimerase
MAAAAGAVRAREARAQPHFFPGRWFAVKFTRSTPDTRRARPSRPLALLVAGTRPEAIKLAPVVRALERHPALHYVLVNSGQHTQAVRATFGEFGIAADIELQGLPALPNLAAAFRHLRTELRAVVARHRPAWVLVQGDTLTAHSAAVAGRDAGSEVAHVEAGLRTDCAYDPFPEEWFRRRIARVADIHFAPTAIAGAHLREEGIAAGAIHVTGNTGIDSLRWVLDDLKHDGISRDAPRCRVLVTLHRRENYDSNADVVCRALMRLAATHAELRFLFPVHPNPRVAAPIRRRLQGNPAFELVAPMPYRQFIRAAAGAALIISDSGGIQEEAPHLGTPLLVPRRNTERPEGVATGFVRLVPVREDAIVDAANAALRAPRRHALPIDEGAPFGAGDAADRIVRVLSARAAERACA